MLIKRKAKTNNDQNDAHIRDLLNELKIYQDAKKVMDQEAIANERWFESKHWQYIKGNQKEIGHEPTTPFILNAVWNKHADALDNYPEPIFLEREPGDKEEADKLSKIMPLVLEKNDFEKTYSDVWWQKLKQGTGVYYVGWDSSKEGGLGDIVIKKIDLLRFFAQPHIDNIQDSKYIFVLSIVDTELLKQQFPGKEIVSNAASSELQGYMENYQQTELAGKSLLIDCYERRRNARGKIVLHLTKIVGETMLYSSRQDERMAEEGLYEHGLYPFVIDPFIPKESSLYGIGMVECAKSTQEYIDKLDYLIEYNALASGRPRWLVKRSSGVRPQDITDLSKDLIECDSSVDDSAIRQIQSNPIPAYLINHRQNKISELKEVLGNRDFAQGGVSGGVTAYGAISALQEAGNKLSRDTIKSSYRAFHDIVNICVELIREFYDEQRCFRIAGDNGKVDYTTISNAELKMQQRIGESGEIYYRKAIFDIKIIPQRKNPFNTNTHNQLVLQLLQSGAFTPQAADSAIVALNAMVLDNKDRIIQSLQELKANYQQQQQMQMMQAQQIAAIQAGAQLPQTLQGAGAPLEIAGGGVAM